MLVNISASYAGGLILYEQGTKDVGLASAGWAARGQDAATLFRNPAAMSLLDQSQVLLGAQMLYAAYGFKPAPGTTVQGNDGGNPVGVLPNGGIFYVHNTSDEVRLGIGVFSYFGLSQSYNDGWVGRYYIQEATLLGLTVMPSISYRISPVVSLGLGINAMYGILDEKVAINNSGPQPDGMMAFDDSRWGIGANVGLLFETSPTTRIGIDYLSQVSLNFEGTPQFSGLGTLLEGILTRTGVLGTPLEIGMKVPHAVMASVYHELDERVALMGNIGWQNWKSFGMVDIIVGSDDSTSLTTDLKFKDTWHIAAGAEWKLSEEWQMTAGIAYDSSPLENQDRPVAMPLGAIYRFGIGAQWQTSGVVTLGFAYELGYSGNLPVDQFRGQQAGRVVGSFAGSAMHFFALNLKWTV